jgi:hypothetical protein
MWDKNKQLESEELPEQMLDGVRAFCWMAAVGALIVGIVALVGGVA